MTRNTLGERLPDVSASRAANENAEPRSRGVTGEVQGNENGNEGDPARPAHQRSNHAQAPRSIDAYTNVFSALRQLGFREGEVKAVLGELGHPVSRGCVGFAR